MIIDSYETDSGKGIPLGNQTSQWFAIYYLNSLDRMIKENFRVRYYSRYMDDFVLIAKEKEKLKSILLDVKVELSALKLELNTKTQIIPIRNGVLYLGFHFYATETGKVIMKISNRTKHKFKRRLKEIELKYAKGQTTIEELDEIINSYLAHLKYGNTYHLRTECMKKLILKKR